MGCKVVYTFGESEEMGECLICVCKDVFHDSLFLIEFMCRGSSHGGRMGCGTESIEFGVQGGEVGT